MQEPGAHPVPLDEFVKTVVEIRTVLEALRDANDEHYDLAPEEITWANVGDARRTLKGLQEVLNVVRGEVK